MKKTTTVLLVLALAIAIFSAKAAYAGGTSQGNVTIANTAPTIGTVTLWNTTGGDTAISLTAGSTVTVIANATVSDVNGGANIANASAALYHSTSTSAGAADENINIKNATCLLGTPSGNNVLVTCAFTMNYMALNGTWTANISAMDLSSAAIAAEDANTVNSMAGLDVVTAVVEFGDLALSASSSSATNMSIRSQGNIPIDAYFKGDTYTCTTTGTIPVTNTKYGLTAGAYAALSTGLTDGDIRQDLFDLGVRGVVTADGANSDVGEYWGILIPDSGVAGTCTNTLTVTAVA
jgi:hypothetical protein